MIDSVYFEPMLSFLPYFRYILVLLALFFIKKFQKLFENTAYILLFLGQDMVERIKL